MGQSLVGKQIGNYKITRLLGEGGMGAVFLGEHPLIGKKVAVKVLHDELAQKEDIVSRFFTEAKAVNDIGHENIVDIVDFGKMKDDDGKDVVYFIMEFLEGESLSDRLKRGGITHAQAVRIITQAAGALSASHAKGIVHRDLKPDNIHLIRRGSDDSFVKLLDFGIAKLTGDSANNNKTRAGSVLGTPAYMSPEQCDGRGNIDYRSDVYSLGMVMYELLTGRVAFTGEGFGEILVAQITLPPPPLSSIVQDIPPELEAIVLRCLEKDRELRFQSMDELRVALENLGIRRGTTGLNKVIDEEMPYGRNTQQPTMMATNRPTTLSGSAGEATVATPGGGSKAPLWIGLAVLIAGGGAGGVYFMKQKKAPTPIAQPTPVTPPAPKIDSIHVLIDSMPQGAKIMRAGVGEAIGVTPKEITLKKGEAAFEILVSLEHHKIVTRSVPTDRDRDIMVALEKIAEPVSVPAVIEKPTTTHSSGSGHKLPTLRDHHDTGLGAQPLPDRPANSHHVDPDGVLAPSL